MFKKIIYGFLMFLGCLAIFVLVLALKKPAGVTANIEWGAAFSKFYADQLGLDWKKTYLAVLDELGPKYLRLPVYWQDVEPQSESYIFDDYDWMVKEASDRDIKIILVIGRRVPRWPECHIPDWAVSLNEKSQQSRILKLIPEIVNHYKNEKNLYAWQVENEPFLAFGECPTIDGNFLDREIEVVRSLDSSRPIMVTDSGELSIWLPAAKRADIFGTTMYRTVWNQYLGFYKYPLPPQFFWLKANLVRIFNPGKPIIVSELQGEPWTHKRPPETSMEDQMRSMSFEQFKENINYAEQVGFSPVYFWGVEWWYWMKITQDRAEYWDYAREIISGK